jgi:hypothetical protein
MMIIVDEESWHVQQYVNELLGVRASEVTRRPQIAPRDDRAGLGDGKIKRSSTDGEERMSDL